MVRKKILVVGGGFGGVKTALELANDAHFDVTLITPRSRFEYHGAMYRSATGKSPLEVVIPLSEIFAHALNVRVELDSIAELRPQTNEVEGESGRAYSYDYLVMAVGYTVNYFNIPGMANYSENMYDISAAIKLRHRLVGAFRNSKPHRPIHISVIGAGPTGVEIASDIENFAKLVASKHAVEDLRVEVRLVEAAPRVLAILSEQTSQVTQNRLGELGVEVMTDARVTKCTEQTIVVNDKTIHSDITIWTAGNKAHSLFGNYPDLFTLDEKHRVQVGEYFNADSPDIFVIGDAASTPYAGMAQTAIHNAIALADNLKRVVRGQDWMPYKPKKPDYVVPVGGEWAVLETEDTVTVGKAGWQARRSADKWVLENFLVYDLANKHWQHGEQLADF